MKLLVLLVFWSLSFSAFSVEPSTGISGIFTSIENFFSYTYTFITDVIPTTISGFFLYIKLWLTYHYALHVLDVLKYSHQFALNFIAELNINDVINVAIGNLPPDLRSAATEMRVFDALTLLTEALITRFVFSLATR